jgi:hypothetical protein
LKKLYSLLLVFFYALVACSAQSISFGAGLNYGGPLPTEFKDSTSGKPIAGLMAGMSFSIPLSKNFSFSPALYYSFRGVEYSQSFTRDTLVTVVFNGTSGQVPSFYTAYVSGAMRLSYIDIPLLITYRFRKYQIMFGPYFSVLVAGKDAGKVRIVIGTGGFFDDYTETFNNFKAIRKVEQGLMIGSNISIYKNLSIETRVSRSFFSLYSPGKLPDRGQGSGKMFNTFVHVGVVYKLKNEM